MSPRHGGCPGATPGSRTIPFVISDFRFMSPPGNRLRVSTRQSLQNSADSGRHRGSLPILCQGSHPIRTSGFGLLHWGRGRQVMHLPCKQGHAGALPADSTNFNCGENEIQASLISSASVGATPTPATNLGRCSGCPTVNRASQNMCRKRRLERYQHFPPVSWTRSSKQSAPLSAGGLRVQAPSGPPFSESHRGAPCQGSMLRVPEDPRHPRVCPGFSSA